jgi:hypothetical protein
MGAGHIRWTTGAAPRGTYTVRVDYWSSCGVSQTNYVVTVKNGTATQLFQGTFTGVGDKGDQGSGRLITSISHTSSVGVPFPISLPDLFVPSPDKVAHALAHLVQ